MYSKRLLNKVEALLKSYEGDDKLGKLSSYGFNYNKLFYGDKDSEYELVAYYSLLDNKSTFLTVRTHKFEDPRYCYISMKEQLKFEVESTKIKNRLEKKLSNVGELELLKMELQEAIEIEDYEEAEKIKKEITEFEKQKS